MRTWLRIILCLLVIFSQQSVGFGSGSAPLPNSFFSLDLFHTAYDTAGHFPIIPFGSIRPSDAGIDWRGIETSNGNYTWTKLDTWIGLSQTHGQDMLWTINGTPAWASLRPGEAGPGCSGCAAPPSDVDSGDALWKAWVTAAVTHSKNSVKPVKYYEIWNEFDGGFWTGTSAQMVTLAKDATAIIHSIDPNAKVLSPSISSCCTSGNGLSTLTAYLQAGGGSTSAQDILSLHSYPSGSEPLLPDYIKTELQTVKNLVVANGLPNIHVMYTEGSYNGSVGSSKTDAQKIAFLAQQFINMWNNPPMVVDRYYWFQYDNVTFGTLATFSGATPTLTPEGVAFQRLESWMVGSTSSSAPCATAGDGTVTCNLTLMSGAAAQIIYNNTTSKTVAVDPKFVTSYSLTNASDPGLVNNNSVSVSTTPIMISALAPPPSCH